jgi:L-ascorbate metabolism protein UlaG (beta-lactamase superfamily)
MRVTKYTHACLRIERDGAVLVIDPGTFTEPAALDGVDAVLITHEHVDHLDADKLADALAKRPAVTVHTHQDVAGKLDALAGAVTTVESGQEFTAAGFAITAYGGWHAVIHPDVPVVPNLGFLVENSVYHPGDSFDVPVGAHVEALFVPISGPWLKLSESVDFIRAVAPRKAYGLHDFLLSDIGQKSAAGLLGRLGGCDYTQLAPGSTVDA